MTELARLQREIELRGLGGYLIPAADPHGSESVGEHFKARERFSGFTGSAGTLLVLPNRAYLFTDGRYFLQAASELIGSGIELCRMGEPGVPELAELIEKEVHGPLGLDGRTLSAGEAWEFLRRGIDIADVDLVSAFWQDRPPLSDAPAWLLPEELCGKSASEKLAELRREMAPQDAQATVLTALDDIAWLFNLRGSDTRHTPVALCYAAVERERAVLFMDEEKRRPVEAELRKLGVEFLPYEEIYAFVRKYRGRVMTPLSKLNYRLLCGMASAEVLDADLIALPRAIKNAGELANLRRVHLADGAVMARFMRYVKLHAGEPGFTEVAAGRYLDEMRKAAGALSESFDTICGYGPHGAIVHYAATQKTDIPIGRSGLLLVDSGGQYMGGTTDVTRTIATGPVSDAQKAHFTWVLKGMLALMSLRFPEGCTGQMLDVAARAPLWAQGLNYNHGTGHGVGYMLNVHEGPQSFRFNRPSAALAPGMVISDEPGIYIEGSFGVRLENLLVCVGGEEGFLRFESLTFAPIDLDAVDERLLDETDKSRLNEYHRQVYEKLSPLMEREELAWLEFDTRNV